ncbi:hypothetical protein ACHAPJ_012918 [Fusarium lateritium]
MVDAPGNNDVPINTKKRTAPPSEDPKPKPKASTDPPPKKGARCGKTDHLLSTCPVKKKEDTELRQEGTNIMETQMLSKITVLTVEVNEYKRLAEGAKADAIKARKETKETKEDLANTKFEFNKTKGELATLRGEMDAVLDWTQKQ